MSIVKYILPLMALSAAAHAQPQACTQIGCVDGLTISVPMEYEWKKGNYAFDFLIDGRSVKCSGALPLKSCEEHNITCSSDGVMIMESGCALPPEAHGFGDIMLGSDPRQVAVKIRYNGEQIASGNWTPHYQSAQPNGSGCGPVCRQASVKLDMH